MIISFLIPLVFPVLHTFHITSIPLSHLHLQTIVHDEIAVHDSAGIADPGDVLIVRVEADLSASSPVVVRLGLSARPKVPAASHVEVFDFVPRSSERLTDSRWKSSAFVTL